MTRDIMKQDAGLTKELPEIDSELDQLHRQANELEEVSHKLQARLGGVMRPAMPEVPTTHPLGARQSPVTQYGDRIRAAADTVDRVYSRILDLIHRLEISE